MTKELSLIEIRTVAEKVHYLIGGQIGREYYKGVITDFGTSYKVGSWGKTFTDKTKDIYQGQDKIVLKYCPEGENTVPQDKLQDYIKEVTDYLNTKDNIEVSPFQVEWLHKVQVEDCSILHQFVEQSV